MSTATSDLRSELARMRAFHLRKAGLVGAYAAADCELGRRVLALCRSGRGAYLWGEPGRGKTYAAACAVRLWVSRSSPAELTARLVTASELLEEARRSFGDRSAFDAAGFASRVPLLALDDLGAERPTEWAMETLSRIVDARVAAGLPTIVTSNLTIGGLRDLWGGTAGKRVASRLAGTCERIEVGGADRRTHGQG